MSLLNDMLQDLSHQQKPVETAAAANQATLDFNAQEQRELFYHTRVAKPFQRTLIPSLVVFVLVLVILAVWRWDFFTQFGPGLTITDPAVVAQASVSSAVATISTTVTGHTTPLEQTVPMKSTPVTESVESNAIGPELGERLAALESAITNLSVVVANANNLVAKDSLGIEPDINDNRVPTVLAQDDESAVQAELTAEQTSAEEEESVSIREPFAPVSTENFIEPVTEKSEPQLLIAPNGKWKDQQQAQQASQLVTQGQTDAAIEQLQHFIVTATQPRDSVKALLDIFTVQENISAMQILLEQAHYLSAVDQAFYAAKIAVIQQQDAQAIELLEPHLGEAERDENYRALLAGLYQRTGMHLEAANHYRRLLGVFGDKPAYWLGFALAQDALNQPQIAAQAYQRVNQYVDLQPQVRSYIQQRIEALQ